MVKLALDKLGHDFTFKLRTFESKYEKISHLLETNTFALTTSSKLEIILAAESFLLDAAALLQRVQADAPIAEKELIPNLDSNLKQLRPIQIKHAEQQLDTLVTTSAVEELVDTYNSTLRSLAAKIVEWDEQLTRWESEENK